MTDGARERAELVAIVAVASALAEASGDRDHAARIRASALRALKAIDGRVNRCILAVSDERTPNHGLRSTRSSQHRDC